MRSSTGRVLGRYLLLQTPGWAAVALLVTLARGYFDLSLAAGAAILGLWVIKDLVLFRFLRSAYEVDHRSVVERLIGEHGAAIDELAPRGYIHIRGERWRAEVHGTSSVAPGHPVVVVAVRESILIVVADVE